MKNFIVLLVLALTVLSFDGFSRDTLELRKEVDTIHLNTENTVSIVGPITMQTSFKFMMDVLDQNTHLKNQPIYVIIDSYGGDVAAAEIIINIAIQSARPVHTIPIVAASAAFNIVQSLGKRFVIDRSMLLTHNAFITEFKINETATTDIISIQAELVKIYQRISGRLGLSLNDYYSFMASETWIRGNNNLTANTADKLVKIVCDKPLILSGNCPK